MTATLQRSKDRKVTNLPNKAGKQALIANAFGLPAGQGFSCPGATSFCEKICYAGRLEKAYKGVKGVMMRNWDAVQACGDSVDALAALIRDMVAEFEAECVKRDAPMLFRIHWDGDFYSLAYAEAWARVIREFPEVRFWVYTRSFTAKLNVVPILAGIPNLTLYLSADPVNSGLAREVSDQYGVPTATVAQTFAEAREAMPADKSYNCPENGGRIALIDTKGSACVKCGICVVGRGNVNFAVGKA